MKNKHLIKTLSELYCLYSDFESDIKQIKDAILKDLLIEIKEPAPKNKPKPIINIAENEDDYLPF